VRRPLRSRTRRTPAEDPEINRALEAMSAPELRAAVHAVLDVLDADVKAHIIDTLIVRATKATSGWRPNRPSQRIIDDAKSFADAARRTGHADPEDVSEHLRRATKAFHAGDHASARAVFEAILPPIAIADIDLGQHELVEEVLAVDARACVAQYVTSVYTTTPLRDRADAMLRAIEQVEGVGTLSSPIKDMEDVSAGALSELGEFLPLWVKRLGRFRPADEEWETHHERWLREAVFRADGVAGLERIARKTKRPQACLAWCDALAEQGDWAAALRACDAAAALVGQSHWRGNLLDGAALAAQQLGRPDRSKRLEAAWRAAPTLTRLLRWLVADGHSSATVRTKAKKALALCPKNAGRQTGVLHVLLGGVAAAAALLSKAPGLGWSDPEHPGHAVFPLLALLLSDGTPGVSDALMPELEATGCDPLEVFSDEDTESKPKLSTYSITRLIHDLHPSITLTDADRNAAIDAMRDTAEKRVEGILGNSRRRHYGHAALLVAWCVASAPAGREREQAKWAADLRQQYWRRHAFREELTRAFARLGLAPLS
jgi:hypothetical protein